MGVAVGVELVVVGDAGAVVGAVGDRVAIEVVVAHVAKSIVVEVELVWVPDRGTVVTDQTHAIVVQIAAGQTRGPTYDWQQTHEGEYEEEDERGGGRPSRRKERSVGGESSHG